MRQHQLLTWSSNPARGDLCIEKWPKIINPFCFSAARRRSCMDSLHLSHAAPLKNKKIILLGLGFYKQATPSGSLQVIE
jgi:hypothetical protein